MKSLFRDKIQDVKRKVSKNSNGKSNSNIFDDVTMSTGNPSIIITRGFSKSDPLSSSSTKEILEIIQRNTSNDLKELIGNCEDESEIKNVCDSPSPDYERIQLSKWVSGETGLKIGNNRKPTFPSRLAHENTINKNVNVKEMVKDYETKISPS